MSPLLVAFLIGVAFGAVLERAGLGDARKLTAQFRLTDLTVLKVMFTAIVTAMLGLVGLDHLGVVDTARLALAPTWLVPQAVGGLVFGAGFVAGGYCPGTSCVAAAAGRFDALATLAGIALGTFVFGEALPLVESFHRATPLGAVTLPEVFGLARGTVILAVVVLALAAFAVAERIERRAGRGGRGGRGGRALALLALALGAGVAVVDRAPETPAEPAAVPAPVRAPVAAAPAPAPAPAPRETRPPRPLVPSFPRPPHRPPADTQPRPRFAGGCMEL